MKPNTHSNFKETEIGFIPDDWDVTTLDEISLKVTDGSHFSPKESTDSKNIICTVKDMRYNSFSFESAKRISNNEFNTLLKNGCSPQNGDILISKDGANCLDLIFVYDQDKEIVLLSSIAIVRLKDNFYPLFYRYFLLSPIAQGTMRNGYISGSAIPRVVLKDFKKLPVPLIKNYDEQKSIADFLSALDQKIELNQKMNQTLEEIGQAIFNQWFVHFEFPDEDGKPYKSSGGEMVDSELGEIPAGWEIKKLGDICNITMGQSPKSEFYNEHGDGLPFHQGVTNFGERFPKDKIYCTVENKIAEKGDILFSVRAPVGRINIANSKMVIGRGLCSIRHENNLQSFILYQLKNIFIEEDTIGSGTVFNAITRRDLDDLLVLVPNSEISTEFNLLMSSMDKEIENLTLQNLNLSKIRDSLLQKLMSGKIRVPKKEQI